MNSWQKIRMAKQQQVRVARQHRAAKLGRLYKAKKLRAELCEKLQLQRVNNDAALAKAFEEEFVYPHFSFYLYTLN
ncbi:p8.9 [Orgyia pseudotsugata multiple nucleopolyhedrovirus]|uniref:8.9 kDa basic protein n=1 Tax=Orgyia pseudotsugata multicapsid polyhedrosis virus TaxID=262177 RepID=VP09_NPVOP|nr:p8.9 [Orgyia pseudotsugata multiple nucleopolyhedrovirus]P41724.1 RecName: Full=8.9 kDa basic protein [Orgyia pseudotsugata multiple nucleopolyhedrovirus]pir/T10418/ protein p8.9 - Orgyia pseudotsugata nuclear polyhedrosis virus [Orgyia pseudotsugata single capsid nuclopolyhedrovirus]AAB27738.1 8.9 kda basic protein [Orgyia pseudotsugata multiple nucleopolyhedrovirus]AAC59148.1 p8.9 [Orgyia pseudotsugata multiple nucleopolyhedrovirus]